jgi:hypothetical protein
MNLKELVGKVLSSRGAVFNVFAGLASILSLYGWAAEKFFDYAPEKIGFIAFIVILCAVVVAVYFLVSGYLYYEKMRAAQGGHVLNHKITHQLRNAIVGLQDLEYATTKKMEVVEREIHFSEIKENDELRRRDLFKKLASKVCNIVARQIGDHFSCNQIDGNVRTTIKIIIPDGDSQLDWKIVTAAVDAETWNDQDRLIEAQAYEQHKIGDNSDFEGIVLGKKSCFSCNDLQSLSSRDYKNSSPEWRSRYNATLVVPIKSKPDGQSDAVYYGFITADSLNPSKQEQFSSDINSAVVNIMAHAADAMAVWFIKNDNHVKSIERAETERIGLLVLWGFIDQHKLKISGG